MQNIVCFDYELATLDQKSGCSPSGPRIFLSDIFILWRILFTLRLIHDDDVVVVWRRVLLLQFGFDVMREDLVQKGVSDDKEHDLKRWKESFSYEGH